MQPQTTPLTRDLDSLFEHVQQLERIQERSVEFGNPAHPENPADTTLAGALPANHNGSPDNVLGSWVEIDFVAADAPHVCYHNLGMPVIAGQLNVTWLEARYVHNGAGPVGATSTLSVNYQIGDPVTPDSVALRLYAGAPRTVDEDNPVRVTFFFIPAVMGSAGP